MYLFTTPIQLNRWTDRNLYLGTKRYAEDQYRPMPVPGLGENQQQIELYLGAAPPTTSRHWDSLNGVEVEHVYHTTVDAYVQDAYTYTGEPTSNVTYTSIRTTVCISR